MWSQTPWKVDTIVSISVLHIECFACHLSAWRNFLNKHNLKCRLGSQARRNIRRGRNVAQRKPALKEPRMGEDGNFYGHRETRLVSWIFIAWPTPFSSFLWTQQMKKKRYKSLELKLQCLGCWTVMAAFSTDSSELTCFVEELKNKESRLDLADMNNKRNSLWHFHYWANYKNNLWIKGNQRPVGLIFLCLKAASPY